MKFTINTVEFKNAMEKSYKAITKKSALSILQNVRMHVESGNCYIIGTNLENFVISKIDIYGVDKTCDIIFCNTPTLLKAMKFFTAMYVGIDVEENKATISCGNKETVQKIENVFAEEKSDISIPNFDCSNSVKYQYDINSLKERLNLIKYAASKDDLRPVFMGIHFCGNDMVALDGYRMALSKSKELNIETKFTVPVSSVELMIDVLKKDIVIETNDKFMKVSDRDTTIISRLYEGEYINYKGIIPKNGQEISVSVSEYEEILKYFKAFKDTGKKPQRPYTIWFNNKLIMFNLGANGTLSEIDGQFKAPIGFDNEYMLDAIAQFKTDKVKILIDTPTSPMIIKNDDDYLAVVCPFKVDPKESGAD